jgi:two-component system OmpR family response regulator
MSLSSRPRIFVAEDDPGTLDLIMTRLTLAGYEVAYGRDGWEAIRGIRANLPAGVVLDINMPNLDGFGVMKNLRDNPVGARLPIMVLTARHAPEDVRHALALGARDFLAKPFKDEQLLARVARLIRPPSALKAVGAS